VSLNISLSHSRSLKVIRNDTLQQGVEKSLLIFHWNYRVAQIKIPHQTKCNFSTTVWEFDTQISWFIYGRDPAIIFKFKKFFFTFLQSYGYINILCHIFNSAQNNQQQLVIFIHVMVSARVCFDGKEKDCISFQTRPRLQICFAIWLHLSTGRRACTHGKAGSRLDCYTNCSEFIGKDEWPPNSSDLPCLGSYAWTLQVISTQAGEHRWVQESSALDMGPAATRLDQESHWASRRLEACVKAGGGHSEDTLKWTTCQILVFIITVSVSWQWKLQVAVDYSVQNWKYGIEYLYSDNSGEN